MLGPGTMTLAYSDLDPTYQYTLRISGIVALSVLFYNGAFEIAAVPLPPSIILLGTALMALIVFSRTRRRYPRAES